VRDILHLIDVSPDKAITRFAHNSHITAGGDEAGFKLLRTLRGSLIAVEDAADPNIWTVASLDGENYTVVVFNDHYQAKDVQLEIKAPPGYSFAHGTIAQAVNVENKGVAFEEKDLAYSDGNSIYKHHIRLNGKDAVRYLFTLRREAEAELKTLKVEQFPAPEILQTATSDQPALFQVSLPAEPLAEAQSATLRFVHESNLRWRAGDLRVTVNGTEIPGKAATDYLVEFDLPLEILQADNTVGFYIAPEAKDVLICTTSILLEDLQN
jgi:hypothetical protein